MKYRAIQTEKHQLRYDTRDEVAGIIGAFASIEDETVLFSSDSKPELELQIKGYFYDHPNKVV